MSSIPDNLRYTKEHVWVRREGDSVVMGITDHAQDELGDIIHVELPEPGTRCSAGQEVITVESVKTQSEVPVPLAGEIVDQNSACIDDPSLINKNPYDEGWLVKMRPEDPDGVDSLLSSSQYASETGE